MPWLGPVRRGEDTAKDTALRVRHIGRISQARRDSIPRAFHRTRGCPSLVGTASWLRFLTIVHVAVEPRRWPAGNVDGKGLSPRLKRTWGRKIFLSGLPDDAEVCAMEKMSLAEMRVKIRTPIGLLLVLVFGARFILDTFEEGRVILENMPPILHFVARPIPSLLFLAVGLALIFWEINSLRRAVGEPATLRLRHHFINSAISFVGLLLIVGVVGGCYALYARIERRKPAATTTGITSTQEVATPPPPASAPEGKKGAPLRPTPQVAPSTPTIPTSQSASGSNAGAVGSITQGTGSIAQVGGSGNTATVNNIDTQPHIVINAAQQSAITHAMRQFAGRKAIILTNGATAEQVEFGNKMLAALQDAGIHAEFHTGIVMSEGAEANPWIFVGWGEHNSDMAKALLTVLRDAGVVPIGHVGTHYYPDGDKDGFQIFIFKPDNPSTRNINTGPCSNVQVGGSNNQSSTNCGPPPLVLEVTSVETTSSKTSSFSDKPGFLKTEITIVPNQPVTAPFTIALDFDNPITEIGNTVKNVGAQLGGGPYRVGVHARDTVGTSIGPGHPLVVVVFSLVPVKLVGVPRVEY